MQLDKSITILDFFRDAKRYALWNRSKLKIHLYQLYSSALIYSPEVRIIPKKSTVIFLGELLCYHKWKATGMSHDKRSRVTRWSESLPSHLTVSW